MKIDKDYLRNLMLTAEACPNEVFDVLFLQEKGIEIEDGKFMLHMDVLTDRALICRDDRSSGYGYERSSIGGDVSFAAIPLRLTAEGHDFCDSIRDMEVWKRTTKGLEKVGGVGIEMIMSIGKAYAKQVLKEKLGLTFD